MDMHLQPLATNCFVSGQPFADGDRVASFLVRNASLEIVRYDVSEANVATFAPAGYVACRWVHRFKPRSHTDSDAARALKLSAENLFLTLADPTNELNAESTRLVQFLALMLERKKVIRPRGLNADGSKQVFEHAKTKQVIEVPAGELTPEFFVAVQEQLSVLVGAPKPKAAAPAAPEPAPAATEPASAAS
ncbi:MAG: hypothetical protein HZA93_14290 [Verrucomicrobia bacterium]|nr:hypothetical protein [Verrucomicrobiota bacterium]